MRALSEHTPGRKWIGKLRDQFAHQGMGDRCARFSAESVSAIAHSIAAALLSGMLVYFAHAPVWIVPLSAAAIGVLYEAYAISNYVESRGERR